MTVGPTAAGAAAECAFIAPIALAYEGGAAAAAGAIAARCGGGVLGIGGATGAAGAAAPTLAEAGAAPNAAVPLEAAPDPKPPPPVENDDTLSNPPNPPPKPSPNPRFNPSPGPRPPPKPPPSPAPLIPVSAICGFGNGCASSLNCTLTHRSSGSSVRCPARDSDNHAANPAASVPANRPSVISC